SDLVRWYGAPIGGLNLANNCVDVTVWPAPQPSAPAMWSIWPPTPAAIVQNNCVSAPGLRTTPGLGRRPGTFELVLSGKVGERSELQAVSVHDPVTFAATAIRQHLADAGITIAGDIRYERVRTLLGDVPGDVTILDRHRTPLASVLQRVGTDSQNMCAEAIFKRLGWNWAREHGDYDSPGSWSNGREAVSAFLISIGCDLNTITIADGSGLSRSNRATATEFVHILEHMYNHPRRELFIGSLAGSRTGGTLRRLRDFDGEVYAKTGYMSGVRALSGYVHSQSDRWYAFSVIFNGFVGTSRPYYNKSIELCRILSNDS
ncbi:MAG TPA: D-alanyl-D-alanine carboxypeptidase/D-alanyl-D-alanine-endopeptidase, partial [Phycisphaerae bacterium]|nr:D-alanyl-D-alanine carboxypeptidase/D-alanyl-D-alanine-endopeptidase [Phycisphaerae bacterium]